MRKSFGLTISLSVVIALFSAAVCQGDLASDLIAGIDAEACMYQIPGVKGELCPPGNPKGIQHVEILDGPLAGIYSGWCAEYLITAWNCNDNGSRDVELYREADPDMDLIDCLLNNVEKYLQQGYCVWHIQWVIWMKIGSTSLGSPPARWSEMVDDPDGKFDNDIKKILRLMDKVERDCRNFQPGPGDVMAVFIDPGQDSGDIQNLIIPVPVPDEGGCDGKVTELTLEYTGASSAQVKVEQKDGGKVKVIFDASVVAGGNFTINGVDNQGTLGPEIKIYVNGVFNTCIHTSCSQDIGPDLIRGAFKVLSGTSRNGGILTSVDSGAQDDIDCDDSAPAPSKDSDLSTLWGKLKTE